MEGVPRAAPIPPPGKSRAARHLPGHGEPMVGMWAQGWRVALMLHHWGRGWWLQGLAWGPGPWVDGGAQCTGQGQPIPGVPPGPGWQGHPRAREALPSWTSSWEQEGSSKNLKRPLNSVCQLHWLQQQSLEFRLIDFKLIAMLLNSLSIICSQPYVLTLELMQTRCQSHCKMVVWVLNQLFYFLLLRKFPSSWGQFPSSRSFLYWEVRQMPEQGGDRHTVTPAHCQGGCTPIPRGFITCEGHQPWHSLSWSQTCFFPALP